VGWIGIGVAQCERCKSQVEELVRFAAMKAQVIDVVANLRLHGVGLTPVGLSQINVLRVNFANGLNHLVWVKVHGIEQVLVVEYHKLRVLNVTENVLNRVGTWISDRITNLVVDVQHLTIDLILATKQHILTGVDAPESVQSFKLFNDGSFSISKLKKLFKSQSLGECVS
jgi:hypothetical protein